MIVTQSSFMPTVLPLQRPAWWGSSECGFWMCPFCAERFERDYKSPVGLGFSLAGAYRVGRCGCGYWVRFANTMGYSPWHVAGRVLEFGREVVA